MLFLEGFFTVDVVHFDVGAPALPGKHGLTPHMDTPKVCFGNLVILLVDL